MQNPKKVIKLGWSGGVNLLVDPRAVRDDQLAGAENCWPTVEGLLAKRQAVTFERLAVKFPSREYHPIALFTPDPTTGFQFVLHYADGSGNEWLTAGTFDNSDEADCPTIQVAAGAPMSYRPMSFANYRGVVVAVGAGNEGFYQLTRATGAGTWAWHHVSFNWVAYDAASTQPQAISVLPQCVGVYRDRLVFANFGTGMGNWMVMADRSGPWAYSGSPDDSHRDNVPLWSQIGPDVLASNGRHIEIGVLQGQSIQAVEEVSTASVSSALQSACLIRTQTKANLAVGEISESTDNGTTYSSYLGDWQPAKVNIDAGIAGPHARCEGPNGVFWASGEDVYALYDGAPKPVIIGTNIRPALRACPHSYHKFWHMAYADGAVYLSVATQNSSDELNLAVQHWRLDIRPTGDGDETAKPMGPANARWWGPMDYEFMPFLDVGLTGAMGACIVAPRGRIDQDTVYGLFFGAGDNSNFIRRLFLVSYNRVYKGYDSPYREVLTARRWAPSDTVGAGDLIMPTALNYKGLFFYANASGVTGGAEPTWPVAGGTVVDNGLLWRELTDPTLAYRTPNFTGPSEDAWRIAMKPDFKEYDFGTNMQDKVFVRADVSAFFSGKQHVWMDVLANGGDLKMHMGPAVIGDFTLGRQPALNDLGLMQLDSGSVAQNFQSRCLRPNDVSREFAIPFPGVVRGRTLQPQLREGQGIVIDDSNDHITVANGVFATDPRGAGLRVVKSVAIDQGYYDTIDDLMAQVVNQMNAQAAAVAAAATGTTWSTTSAYAGAVPYTNNIALATDTDASTWFFLFAADSDAGALNGVTLYLQRSMRLMTTLGFDTSNAYSSAWAAVFGGTGTYPIDVGAVNLLSTYYNPLGGYHTQPINAIQSMPFVKTQSVAITDIEGTFVLKAGRPLGLGDRQS